MPRNKPVIQFAPAIAERDGGWYCTYCGAELVPYGTPGTDTRYFRRISDGLYECIRGKDLAVDHIMPRSRGGSDELDNLRLACRDCNSRKRDMTPAEYAEWLERKSARSWTR